jgi:hypothetical protein
LEVTQLKQIQNYVQERLPLLPWFIIPIYIFFLGHGETLRYDFIFLYNLLLGIIFFRIFDDYFCWNYHLVNSKFEYLTFGKKFLLIFMSMLGLLYISSNFFILPMNLAVLILGFIFLNTVFYIGLKQFRAIVFIQLLKYPLLFFVVSLMTKDSSIIWSLLGSLCFIAHGIFKDALGKQNTIITLSLFSLPILVKYTLRYLV